MNEHIWQLLEIEKTTDTVAIRQAYRAKLPSHHPETDPIGFKALREAYEFAIQYAQSTEQMDGQSQQESKEQAVTPPLTEKQIKENEICTAYQALLNDPKRCFNADEWQKFISSFYDYPMAIIDSVKWRLLEISYEASNVSNACIKLLADNLRWRQQLKIQSPNQSERYNTFLNYIDSEDLFDYTLLPTTNRALQDATINYIDYTKWLFYERRSNDLYDFLSQDTVIYLPNDQSLMLQFANWHCVARIPNQTLLDYALKCITQDDQAEHINIEWKYIAAIQYTMLDKKHESLQAWLDLYNSGHYQEKAASWIAGWCSHYASDYFPLLIIALNNSYCIAAETSETYLYAVPQLTATTVARLAQIDPDEYSPEIASFIKWSLNVSWNYRQILALLLLDDGTNRLYRLYRHAIMLRHGNQTLLQQIIDEQSKDDFEHFILQNLQRQAQQQLTWLEQIPPVQEFKAWLYDSDENTPIPDKFDPNLNGYEQYYGRLWLDRFDAIPERAKKHLNNFSRYANIEMFDWFIFLESEHYYQFPTPPDSSCDKNAYWEWYRQFILTMAIINQPYETAKYLRKENNTFKLTDDDQILPVINIFKYGNWQNKTELYNLMDNNSGLINSILINYPDSIESDIDYPEKIDLKDIENKIEQLWQTKFANQNPYYLMILNTILLYKPEQNLKLQQTLNKIAGDNDDLQKIANSLEKLSLFPSSENKDKYQHNDLTARIIYLKECLDNYCGLVEEDDIEMLEGLKNHSDNNMILRLCAALLLARNRENQKQVDALSLPENKWWQFWRLDGRTNRKGFCKQIFYSLLIIGFSALFLDRYLSDSSIYNEVSKFAYMISGINIIFALKRRANDSYLGEPSYFIFYTLFLLILLPFWKPSYKKNNRYGPPVKE